MFFFTKPFFSITTKYCRIRIIRWIKIYKVTLFSVRNRFFKIYWKYFNVVKICRSASECPNENYVILYSYPLYLGNGKATAGSLKYPYLVLADGTFISIIQYGACIRESSAVAFNPDGTAKKDDNGNVIYNTFQEKYCADLRFDVNGKALPNQYGRDAFEIRYSADGKISGWSATGFDNLIKILRGEDVVYTKYKFGDAKK